jgi:hypothetical protein
MFPGWRHKVVTILRYHGIITLVTRLFHQVRHSHGIRLSLQLCLVNLVTYLLCHDCIGLGWKNHATSLIMTRSLSQVVNNLWQAWWHYQTCYKVILTSLIQSWYNNTVTRLTREGCSDIEISWLYRTCWNNLATSLIISISLYKVLTTCNKLDGIVSIVTRLL